MTVLRSGPSKGYSDNWSKAFGKPKKNSKNETKPKATAKKKSTKAKKVKKK